jgi:hypothetical protein
MPYAKVCSHPSDRVYLGEDGMVRPCHQSCMKCTGPNADDCVGPNCPTSAYRWMPSETKYSVNGECVCNSGFEYACGGCGVCEDPMCTECSGPGMGVCNKCVADAHVSWDPTTTGSTTYRICKCDINFVVDSVTAPTACNAVNPWTKKNCSVG